ncbi:DUF2231 domain-containing protein [Salinibacter ruber]|jgi:uncharacterized membrane protein|nr:DUF2231 domain-containing protein [Salinibacter ruber]MCS3659960.1 putative membrane protein [Salinibacter ruber]
MELIPDWAPNIHPMIVHFPIALIVGALGADIFSLVLRRWEWLRPATVALYIAGGASAVLTYFTGTWAADSVSVVAEAQPLLTEHSNLGWWTMWFFGIYALMRLGTHLWSRTRGSIAVHAALFLLALGGSYLLYETGDHGAEMVYRYGVGVQMPESEQASVEPGLIVGESGWQWQPQSDTAWTGRMRWLEGGPSAVEARLDTLKDGSVALALTPQESVAFALPDTLGAVQVTAEVNQEKFDGTVSLLHHVQDAENYDFLAISDRAVQQGRVSGGEETVMDEAAVDQNGWVTVRAVGDGTHFRGYLGSELVTHPHGEAADPGMVGLRLEGTGTVQLRRLTAEAL